MTNDDFLTIEQIEQAAEGFKDDLTREGKRAVRRKNLDKALAVFMSEEYVDQFVDALRMRAKSQLGRPKEPKKRIRAIYIPEQVKAASGPRVPLSKKQKELQKHAREVAEASRCMGHPKHY